MPSEQTAHRLAFSERLLREAAESCGRRDTWPGYRQYVRITAAVPLDMQIMGKVRYVKCLNASDGGLVVLSREPIPRKAVTAGVRVRHLGDDDDAWVPVTVQHVTRSISGFKVGLAYKE